MLRQNSLYTIGVVNIIIKKINNIICLDYISHRLTTDFSNLKVSLCPIVFISLQFI